MEIEPASDYRESMNSMEIESETLEMEIEYPLVEVDTQTYPIDSSIFQSKPKRRVTVFIDGMNFFCRLTDLLTNLTSSRDMGWMNVERQVESHQLDSLVEIDRAMRIAKKFFKRTIPFGAHIHFVFKEFGTVWIWDQFVTRLFETFINSDSSIHTYTLHVAIPSSPRDKECDDRLTVRLALESWLRNDGETYIISNDKYRSMKSHWSYRNQYHTYDSQSTITDFHQKFSEPVALARMSISQYKSIPLLPFHFVHQDRSVAIELQHQISVY